MKNYYKLNVYLTLLFCVCYQFISAQCEGIGLNYAGNLTSWEQFSPCNQGSSNQIPLMSPYQNPVVTINPKNGAGFLNLNYFDPNKSIMIFGGDGPVIGTDFSFGGGQYEYDVIVQDPNDLKKECHLTLNLTYDLFSCRRIEKVSTLYAQCDSLNGAIIIKRIGGAKIRLIEGNNNEILTKTYSDVTDGDTIKNLKAGGYRIEVINEFSNSNQPMQIIYTTIKIPENLKIESKYKIVCEGNPLTLSAPSSQKYLWSTGETTQSIQVNKGGKYAVEVINPTVPLCQTKDTIDLKFNPRLTLEILQSYKDCKSESLDITYRVKGGTAPYYYQHQGNLACIEGCMQKVDSTFKLSYYENGYYVLVTDATGCSVAKEYKHLPNSSNLKLTYTKNIKICQGDSTVFNDQYPNEKEFKHQWYLDGQAISQGTKNEFFAKKAGKYHVVVTTPWCEVKSDTVTVEEVVPDPIQYVLPISPSCLGMTMTYQAEKNKSNYEWNVLNQAKNIDYNIISGGTDTSSSISLVWMTDGPKQITLNYSNGLCKNKFPAIITSMVERPVNLVPLNQNQNAICQGAISTYRVINANSNNGLIQPLNLTWDVPGAVKGVDYEIQSTLEDEITIKWIKPAQYKLIVFNYGIGSNCGGKNTVDFDITVNAIDQPTLIADKGSVCFGNVIEYKTESGKQNYVWNIPNKIKGIDYNLIEGGDSKSNTMKINWLTQGLNKITVNYSSSNGLCTAGKPAEIYTQVQMPIELFHTTPEKSDVCLNSIATYKVKNLNAPYSIMNQQNLIWTVYGDPSRDYKILAGGNATDSSITVQWLKATKTGIFVNTNDCGNSLSFDVTVHDTINIKKIVATLPFNLCKIDSLKLSVSNLIGNTVQWYFNDKEITKAIDSIFYAKLPGKYNVVIKNAGNCSFTSDYFEFKKDTCNSVAKLNDLQDDKITVYPNPASTLLNIDLNNPNVKSVALVNVLGQKVIHQDLQTMNNVINVQDVTKGMYLVSFFNEHNEIISTKKITIE